MLCIPDVGTIIREVLSVMDSVVTLINSNVEEEEMDTRVAEEWNLMSENVVYSNKRRPDLMTKTVSLVMDPSPVKERCDSLRVSVVKVVMKGPEMVVTYK